MTNDPNHQPQRTKPSRRARDVVSHPRIVAIFGADLRSLALLRIVLACIVLIDLASRAQRLRVHYTDAGVLPRSVLLDTLNPWRWSLSVVGGSVLFQAVVFAIAALAAVCMLVGYRTRLMTFIVWVLVLSIQVRNPIVASGADSLLRQLLFWSLFLPLGARWALDANTSDPRSRAPGWSLSVATVGLFAQIAFMYWFTALLKTGEEWRSAGTALYYALGARHLTTGFGDYLFQYETLLRMLTYASYGLEILAPLLLFTPVFTGPVRTAAVFALMSFHLGIFLTLDLGIFPLTSALCMVCFLPAWFWDRLPRLDWVEDLFRALDDSVRQIARTMVGPTGPLRRTTVVGFARIGSSGQSVPELPDSAIANTVISNPAHRSHDSPVLLSHPIINVVAAFCLLFIFGWNMTSVSGFTMPRGSTEFAFTTGLYQRWDMFAPRPVDETIWYVYRGTLADGTELDLLPTIVQDDLDVVVPLSWEEPKDINSGLYGDKYWRKYIDGVSRTYRYRERAELSRYVCGMWNGHYSGDVRLQMVDIFKLQIDTRPDYKRGGIERRLVQGYEC